MKVLVTGSQGFIGKNLVVRLKELNKYDVLEFCRGQGINEFIEILPKVDFVYHLAGVNRPQNEAEFATGNAELTNQIAKAIQLSGKRIPLVYTSSVQAAHDVPYGHSKKQAENFLIEKVPAEDLFIYRLTNVFGKWSRPNYNSAVATFCYNIANGLPIAISDPNANINLVYIDDVLEDFLRLLENFSAGLKDPNIYREVTPVHQTTVGNLAAKIRTFKDSRSTLITEPVGSGFDRALHATYLSFLHPEDFCYTLPRYSDPRGVFVEMLKTKDSGQFSFFTAGVGITRGGHYHHTKTEKFLILKGKGRYRFRNIITKEFYEVEVDASDAKVVETIPGWSHDITNIGDEELIVMLWANEIFDREKPDTIGHEV